MDYYNLSPSSFADKIKVQRSSISHLLSGRNKPSLDFVLKVIKEFDTVDLYWLLNGKGTFPNKIHSSSISEPLKNKDPIQEKGQAVTDIIESQSKFKKIEKVLLFYSDGTFKEYVQ
jgi:transcriptional regulator with XRE-family HTH domain